jgi:hypothetical protein
MSPLSDWQTCLPVPKRGHVHALHSQNRVASFQQYLNGSVAFDLAFYADLVFTRYSAGVSLVNRLKVWQK